MSNNENTNSQFEAGEHACIQSKDRIFTCNYCGQQKRGGKTEVKRHIQRMHPEKCQLRCDKCNLVFLERADLVKHRMEHQDQNPVPRPALQEQNENNKPSDYDFHKKPKPKKRRIRTSESSSSESKESTHSLASTRSSTSEGIQNKKKHRISKKERRAREKRRENRHRNMVTTATQTNPPAPIIIDGPLGLKDLQLENPIRSPDHESPSDSEQEVNGEDHFIDDDCAVGGGGGGSENKDNEGEMFGNDSTLTPELKQYLSSYGSLIATKTQYSKNSMTYNQQTFLQSINARIVKEILAKLFKKAQGREGLLSVELGFLLVHRETGIPRIFWASLNTNTFANKLLPFGGEEELQRIFTALDKIDFVKLTMNAYPDSSWVFKMVTNVRCHVFFRPPGSLLRADVRVRQPILHISFQPKKSHLSKFSCI